MDLTLQFLLFVASLLANFFSALSGGGAGLIQFPILIFLGLSFSVALATHKAASVALGLGATVRHLKESHLAPRESLIILGAGLPGVVLGGRAWGYGPGEALSAQHLAAEKYRGIRPAFGYPACPDHSEKFRLFDLLGAHDIGLSLTESAAMLPAASVSGLYFTHPKARYFNVGPVGRDQVEAYAARLGRPLAEVERWLGPNLAYDPDGR